MIVGARQPARARLPAFLSHSGICCCCLCAAPPLVNVLLADERSLPSCHKMPPAEAIDELTKLLDLTSCSGNGHKSASSDPIYFFPSSGDSIVFVHDAVFLPPATTLHNCPYVTAARERRSTPS